MSSFSRSNFFRLPQELCPNNATEWGPCSVTCGNGNSTRVKNCTVQVMACSQPVSLILFSRFSDSFRVAPLIVNGLNGLNGLATLLVEKELLSGVGRLRNLQ